MDDATPLANLAEQTRQVYERNAIRFDAERSRVLFEKPWLDRFAALLPPNGTVLDAGCGAGDPIAAYLAGLGLRVTGIDAAQAMIDLASAAAPQCEWLQADMRSLDMDRTFHGIIGWDSFFHLTQDEQRSTLVRFAEHLEPGGALMLTVGPKAGEVAGHVGDDPIYHSSLSPAEYEAILAGQGIDIVKFVPEDPDCHLHTILLARKHACQP